MKNKRYGVRNMPKPFSVEENLRAYSDLGMGSNSLKLAKSILASKNPTPTEISEALCAIGMFAKDLDPWISRVYELLLRMDNEALLAIRESFVIFFAAAGVPEQARYFIVRPRKFSSRGIYFAIDTLIELGETARARALGEALLPEDWSEVEPEDYIFAADAMVKNLQCNHVGALMQYQWCPAHPGIGHAIIQGIAESALAAAASDFTNRVVEYRDLQKTGNETEIELPGNHQACLNEMIEACESKIKSLMAMIPEERWKRYPLEAGPE